VDKEVQGQQAGVLEVVYCQCGSLDRRTRTAPQNKERADKVRPKAGMGSTDFQVIAL
jgi:hypothetical protein